MRRRRRSGFTTAWFSHSSSGTAGDAPDFGDRAALCGISREYHNLSADMVTKAAVSFGA
jgi:hypothetical protein